MTAEKRHFRSIAEYTEMAGLPAPEHPLVYVYAMDANAAWPRQQTCTGEDLAYSHDFYMIAIKKVVSGELFYGRTKYDFSNGSMMFVAPRQEIRPSGVVCSEDIIMIMVHEDFLHGHDIRNAFRAASFFSYATNEALHLSPREEEMMRVLMQNIYHEYQNAPDEFSRDLILSQLDVLLRYADRYYKRQFMHRKENAGDISDRFQSAMTAWIDAGKLESQGTPRIEDLAGHLQMSSRYLSDALKAETGKTAKDHILLHLLDEAKDLLLRPQMTISEVAYQLGFDYPQYFSRLFKKKTGVSPRDFITRNSSMH